MKKNEITLLERFFVSIGKNKWSYLTFLVAFFLINFFIYEKLSIFNSSGQKKIIQTEEAYLSWKNDPKNPAKFNKLLSFINKNPSLFPQIENEVIQGLIYENNIKCLKMGKKVLSRLKKSNQYYLDFAKLTLLITENKLEEAFNLSLNLDQKLKNENQEKLLIYPYNLLRISILAKKLNDPVKEKIALDSLESYIKGKETLFALNLKSLNQCDLTDYIALRKKSFSL